MALPHGTANHLDADLDSNFMRQQAMSSKMLYGRPIPVARIVQGISDRACCVERHAIIHG